MTQQLELPDVGEGIAEGEIISWLVEPGDPVEEDQILAEVETDKAVVDIPSPYEGVVAELHAEAGTTVEVGSVIVTFETDGDDSEGVSAAEDTDTTGTAGATGNAQDPGSDSAAEPAAETPAASGTSDEAHAAPAGDGATAATTSGSHIFAPPRVRRLARELGVDLRTIANANGDHPISETDVRRAAGQLESQAAEQATTSAAESATESEQTAPETAESEPTADSHSQQTAQSSPTGTQSQRVSGPAADREKTLAAPATRQLAREMGVDIDAVPTDKSRDGTPFVEPEAVEVFASDDSPVSAQGSQQLAEPDRQASGMGAETTTGATGTEQRVPYRGIRKAIGDNMEQAKYSAPHVSHHDSAEIEQLVETRQLFNERVGDDLSITYLPFIIEAVTSALKDHPYMNSSLDKDGGEIVLKEHYDIGIATATDRGLVVPVIEDADKKGIRRLAREISDLTSRARNSELSPEEMQGSTFTLTNYGAIGGDHATPIINYPEAAVLGLGAIKQRPTVEDGDVVARHTLPLSLTVDHRLIDGAVAAQFTNDVKTYLNTPEMLLL